VVPQEFSPEGIITNPPIADRPPRSAHGKFLSVDGIDGCSAITGTCVASIAVGRKFGIAQRASLVPVKYKLRGTGFATYPAVLDSWMWVIARVHREKQAGRSGKAIINYSAGKHSLGGAGT
jgi:hypothetical protein